MKTAWRKEDVQNGAFVRYGGFLVQAGIKLTRRRHCADRGCVPTIIAVFYYGTRASGSDQANARLCVLFALLRSHVPPRIPPHAIHD